MDGYTYGDTPRGLVRYKLLPGYKGLPLGVRTIELCTFTARVMGSRMEQGERLYRVVGRSCRDGWRDRNFNIEVSERVLNSACRLCRTMELAGGLGFVIVPYRGAYADVRRAVLQLSECEFEEVFQ